MLDIMNMESELTEQWVEKLCRKSGAILEWDREAANEAILWSQKRETGAGALPISSPAIG